MAFGLSGAVSKSGVASGGKISAGHTASKSGGTVTSAPKVSTPTPTPTPTPTVTVVSAADVANRGGGFGNEPTPIQTEKQQVVSSPTGWTVTSAADIANRGGSFGNEPTPVQAPVISSPVILDIPPLNPAGLLQPVSSPDVANSGSSGSLGSSTSVLDSGFRQELGISEMLVVPVIDVDSLFQTDKPHDSRSVNMLETPFGQVSPGMMVLPSELTARLQGSTGYDPYANIQGITGEEYLASRRAPDLLAGIRKNAPLTAGLYERSAELSAGLQKGFEGLIGYSETAHPVIKFASGAGSAVTGLPQFAGSGIVGFEAASRMAVTKPGKLPETFARGLVGFGGGLVETAKQKPIETAGMVVALIAGPKLIKSGSGKIGEMVKFRGKTFVPAETIIEPQVLSGAERFPLAPRGTTGAELVTEFKTSKFKLPGTETKTGGWHATPEEFAKQTVTQIGTSEGKGMYISPSTSPHFWKIGKDYKLFGFDTAPETPTGIWLETKGITRSPVNTRMSIEAQNRFLTTKATKGQGFISAAFEKGIKPEKEAIIPPETPISRVRFDQFTKWQGKKVPLMEYTTQGKVLEPPVSYPFDFMGGESGITVTRGASGMQLVNVGAAGVAGISLAGMKQPVSAKQETYGELSARQSKISSEYQAYKTPVFTPGSLVLGGAGASRSYKPADSKPIIKSSPILVLGGSGASRSYKPAESKPIIKSSPIVKLSSSGKLSFSSNAPKPVTSDLIRSIQSNRRSASSRVSLAASTPRYPSTTSMTSQSYVKPLQSVVRRQAYPRQAYPSSASSMITPPRKLKLEMPKSKLTTNPPKRIMGKSYGKFPERARVATAGRVLGMKGFKFPWEEEKKSKRSKSKSQKRTSKSK